jgi:hypothetical protein
MVAEEEVALLGPLQLKLTPVVVELAVRVILVVAQVNTGFVLLEELLIVSPAGAVRFCATVVLAIAEQPFWGSVTCSV